MTPGPAPGPGRDEDPVRRAVRPGGPLQDTDPVRGARGPVGPLQDTDPALRSGGPADPFLDQAAGWRRLPAGIDWMGDEQWAARPLGEEPPDPDLFPDPEDPPRPRCA